MYELSDCTEPTFRVFIDIWSMGGGGGGRVCKITFCTCSPPLTHTAIGDGGSLEYRTHNTETHVHKIINVPVFNMALGLNEFDVGNPLLGP
jgi:hypothetical protein